MQFGVGGGGKEDGTESVCHLYNLFTLHQQPRSGRAVSEMQSSDFKSYVVISTEAPGILVLVCGSVWCGVWMVVLVQLRCLEMHLRSEQSLVACL